MRRRSLLALGFLLSLGSPASACPNCKEAVAAQPAEAAAMAQGYNYSVLLMLSVPFGLLCTGAFMINRAVKSGRLPEM